MPDTLSIEVSRVIKAPVKRVYKAFLDADALGKFLPPAGYIGNFDHAGFTPPSLATRSGPSRSAKCPASTRPSGRQLGLAPPNSHRRTSCSTIWAGPPVFWRLAECPSGSGPPSERRSR